MGLHLLTTLVYPLPNDIDFMSQEPENMARMNAWFATLPTGAFLLASACHGLGSMTGASIAMLISKRRSIIPALIIGCLFTLCGISNLGSLPHPSWFPFVDLPLYLILALAAGLLLKRKSVTSEEQ